MQKLKKKIKGSHFPPIDADAQVGGPSIGAEVYISKARKGQSPVFGSRFQSWTPRGPPARMG